MLGGLPEGEQWRVDLLQEVHLLHGGQSAGPRQGIQHLRPAQGGHDADIRDRPVTGDIVVITLPGVHLIFYKNIFLLKVFEQFSFNNNFNPE